MQSLKGKIALITGSSRGLGKEIAKSLVECGAFVICVSRDVNSLSKTVSELWNLGDKNSATMYTVDGTNTGRVYEVFQMINGLDILVNNIGGAPRFGKFEDLADNGWLNTFDLNLMTAVRFTRAALPLLKKSLHGCIVNIASLPAIQPGIFNPDYAVAKAGLVALTKCLANEFGEFGIRANVVCPNTLNGGGLEKNAENKAKRHGVSVDSAKEKILKEAANKNSLKRVGELGDVANMVAFLCSPEAGFITGQCIAVDGGEQKGI